MWLSAEDGTDSRALTNLPRALMLSPSWSADGRSVFVTVNPDSGARAAEIWRYEVATGEGELVVENANGQPSPLVSSPAPGAYGPIAAPDGGHVWKVPTEGGAAPVQLSEESALWIDPVWTPDGSALVVVKAPLASARGPRGLATTAGRLVELPASGGTERVLSDAAGLRSPHFADDKSRIYLSSALQGLVSIGRTGGDLREEVRLPREAGSADFRLSPTGSDVAVRMRDRVMRFPFSPDSQGELVLAEGRTVLAETVSDLDWTSGEFVIWVRGSTLGREGEGDGVPATKTSLVFEAPRATPSGTVVLRGGRVITMRGDEVVPDADVVVTGSRVVYVGAQDPAQIPTESRVIDVSGKVIVPGFIDVHAHFPAPGELLEPESTVVHGAMVLNSGRTHPYGFGWDTRDVGGRALHEHGGAWQGFTTHYAHYGGDGAGASDLGVVVLANARSAATTPIAHEVAALFDPALASPAPSVTPIADPEPEATRVVRLRLHPSDDLPTHASRVY